MILGADSEMARRIRRAIEDGDGDGLQELLDADVGVASARIGDDDESRSLLHVATDWPGNFPRVPDTIATLVAAGADPNARFVGGHAETPLHWAASCNDVAAVDALLDVGADIDAPGAVIAGAGPLADACAFGQWDAARRLVERGATVRLHDAAALGLVERLDELLASGRHDADDVTAALWYACHGGQQATAARLLRAGGDPNWVGWGDATAIDAALAGGHLELADWLRAHPRSVTGA